MTQDQPDLDLLEYVLVSAATVDGLASVAAAVADTVATGAIRVVDAVLLVRADGRTKVAVGELADQAELAPLAAVVDADGAGVQLSLHDIELASVTLAPGVAALLLLVEDRWAGAVSAAARAAGGQVTAGERIGRRRAEAAVGGVARRHRADLLSRSPVAVKSAPSSGLVDQAAQVRKLARLVDQGLLSLEQYEVQRRRVLDG
ncbi:MULTISPECIES: hypothetical protein [unclassified Nocardioides]|uniref:hypothetical protein n=1 Tax=unclassified Nocardioides TaxID=2615069 RepID=UPI000A778262|nr:MULTISPECIES: hypothetical protein [unclassified Nocardioides]